MTTTEDEPLGVYVTLRNDDGEVQKHYAWGATTDEAVRQAEEWVRELTGDDSYVMDDWEAA